MDDDKETEKPTTAPRQTTEVKRPSTRAKKEEKPTLSLPVGEMIANATMVLGCSRWVAAGALHDHDRLEVLSADAAKAEIEKWLKKPVKTTGEQED